MRRSDGIRYTNRYVSHVAACRRASPLTPLWLLLLLLGVGRACPAQDVQNTEPSPSTNSRPITQPSSPQPANHPVPPASTDLPSTNSDANKPTRGGSGITLLPELRPGMGEPAMPLLGDGQAAVKAEALKDNSHAQLLDRVVAVINGDVILDSDVQEEQHFAVFEPYSVPGGKFTPLEAMQHLVSRTLILQQMKEQQIVPPPTDQEVRKQIEDLRKHIPACVQYHCETDAGWRRFLADQGFTEAKLEQRWKQRMHILRFIEVRFRNGIRISKSEIENYYNKNLLPAFERRKVPPPPLAKVTDRIDEVLLQERVTALLNDWLKSLRDSGNVAILDPAYASLGKNPPKPPPGGLQ
jgi:peptidyl-prolyl cis-trans isomerase SurA